MEKRDNKPGALGSLIRMERKRANLTQAQLGKMIGLGEARISKIENGAPITPEVADYILGKIGSELKLKVVSKRADAPFTSFITKVVYHFSKLKNISLNNAFQYLKIFKGLDYLEQFMEIEQTLSYEEITANLSLVCSQNGGEL